MKLQPNETRLDGKWEIVTGKVRADPVAERINFLIKRHLAKVGTDPSGWETLYRDPDDGRYWELVYPDSQSHGGGPPSLVLLRDGEVRSKYRIEP